MEGFGLPIVSWWWLIAGLPVELFFMIVYDKAKERLNPPQNEQWNQLIDEITNNVAKKIMSKDA